MQSTGAESVVRIRFKRFRIIRKLLQYATNYFVSSILSITIYAYGSPCGRTVHLVCGRRITHFFFFFLYQKSYETKSVRFASRENFNVTTRIRAGNRNNYNRIRPCTSRLKQRSGYAKWPILRDLSVFLVTRFHVSTRSARARPGSKETVINNIIVDDTAGYTRLLRVFRVPTGQICISRLSAVFRKIAVFVTVTVSLWYSSVYTRKPKSKNVTSHRDRALPIRQTL